MVGTNARRKLFALSAIFCPFVHWLLVCAHSQPPGPAVRRRVQHAGDAEMASLNFPDDVHYILIAQRALRPDRREPVLRV